MWKWEVAVPLEKLKSKYNVSQSPATPWYVTTPVQLPYPNAASQQTATRDQRSTQVGPPTQAIPGTTKTQFPLVHSLVIKYLHYVWTWLYLDNDFLIAFTSGWQGKCVR